MKSSRAGAAFFAAPFLLAASPAQAGLNLPQVRRVVTLPGETARAVQTPAAASGHELDPSVEALLLSALPQDFREACGAMIENWGEIAKGTAEWRARTLLKRENQLWLAFRCRSRAPEYVNDFDERPALLRLETAKLELFPLASDAENNSTLYHLEFSELLPLEGAQGVALKVSEPAGNPCCDGPESRSGARWMVFADTPRRVVELLSIVTARDDSSHSDDPEVDSETTYRAQITLDRVTQNRVQGVTATFREEVKDITWDGAKSIPHTVSQHSGTLRYGWNPSSFKFQEIK